MSMKTVSSIVAVMSSLVGIVYGWALLQFVQATTGLWAIWIISMIMSVGGVLLSLYARDEFFASQFESAIAKAVKNIEQRRSGT